MDFLSPSASSAAGAAAVLASSSININTLGFSAGIGQFNSQPSPVSGQHGFSSGNPYLSIPDISASAWRQTPVMQLRRTYGSLSSLIDESYVNIKKAIVSDMRTIPNSPFVVMASSTPISRDAAAFASPNSLSSKQSNTSTLLPAGLHFIENTAEERLLDSDEKREENVEYLKRVQSYKTYESVYSMDVNNTHIITGGSCGQVNLMKYSILEDGSFDIYDEDSIHIGSFNQIEELRPTAPGKMSGSIAVSNIGFLPTPASHLGFKHDSISHSHNRSLSNLASSFETGSNKMFASVGDKLVLFDINGNSSNQNSSNQIDYDITSERIQSICAESYVRTSLLAIGSTNKSISIVDTRLCEHSVRSSKNPQNSDKSDKRGSMIYSDSANSIKSGRGIVWNADDAHDGSVQCVKFNPFIPYLLASSGNDGIVKVWDIRYFKNPTARIDGHYGSVNSIAWSTSHVEQLATASLDHRWRLWQLSSTSSTALEPDFDFLVDCPGSDLKYKVTELNTVVGAQLLAETTIPIGDTGATAPILSTIASSRHMNTFYSCSAYGTVTSHVLRRELFDELLPEVYDPIQYPGEHNVETAIYHRSLLDAYDELYSIIEKSRDMGLVLAPYEEDLFNICKKIPAIDPKSWVIPPVGSEPARTGGFAMMRSFRQLIDQYLYILPPGIDKVLEISRLVPKRLQTAFDLIKLRCDVVLRLIKLGKSDISVFLKEFKDEQDKLSQSQAISPISISTDGSSSEGVKEPLDVFFDSFDLFIREMSHNVSFINGATLGVFARAIMRNDIRRGLKPMTDMITVISETKDREFSDSMSALGYLLFPCVYESSTKFFLFEKLQGKDIETERMRKFILYLDYLEHSIHDTNDQLNNDVPSIDIETSDNKDKIFVTSNESLISEFSASKYDISRSKHSLAPPGGKLLNIPGSVESINSVAKDSSDRASVTSSVSHAQSIASSNAKTDIKAKHGPVSSVDSSVSNAKNDARTRLAAQPQPWMSEKAVRNNGLRSNCYDPDKVIAMLHMEIKMGKICSTVGLNEKSAKDVISSFEDDMIIGGQPMKIPAIERTISSISIQLYLESLLIVGRFEDYISILFDMATLYNRHSYPLILLEHAQTIGMPRLDAYVDKSIELATNSIISLTGDINEIVKTHNGKVSNELANQLSDKVTSSVKEATISLQTALIVVMKVGASFPKASMVSGHVENGITQRTAAIRKFVGELGGAVMNMFNDIKDSLYDLFGTSRRVLAIISGGTISGGDGVDRSDMASYAKINLGSKYGATGAMALCERVLTLQVALKKAAMIFTQRRTFGLNVGVIAVGGSSKDSSGTNNGAIVTNLSGDMAASVSNLLGALDKCVESLNGKV